MAETASERRERATWQRRLLPFLVVAISLMGLFFFATSLLQLGRLGEAVAYRPDDSVPAALQAYEKTTPATEEYLRWKTLVLLEKSALDHRYAQVNATLMLRAWTRHLGFLTGMILALTGSIFILARLSESETRISAEGSGLKGALATSSPGIVLAVLGTTLMVITLTIDFEFTTSDAPIYVASPPPAQAAALPPPAPLDDPATLAAKEKELFGKAAP